MRRARSRAIVRRPRSCVFRPSRSATGPPRRRAPPASPRGYPPTARRPPAVGRAAAGFTEVISADGAVSDLVRLVAARFAGDKARLLYLAGEDRSGDAMADLAALGVDLRVIVLYRAAVGAALSDALSEALRAGRLDGALHYSRRSAAALLALAEQAGLLNAVLGLIHYCLSAEVAAPLRQRGAERIQVAASPNEAALIDAIPA